MFTIIWRIGGILIIIYLIIRIRIHIFTVIWRLGDNLDLMISRDINDNLMVIIKGVEQEPNLGVKIIHLSIDYYSEAIDSNKEENNNENAPKTPYDGENMNTSSDDKVNNKEAF